MSHSSSHGRRRLTPQRVDSWLSSMSMGKRQGGIRQRVSTF
jgi:hypothetical protein